MTNEAKILRKWMVLAENDSVAIAVGSNGHTGETIGLDLGADKQKSLILTQDIPQGHKVAIKRIKPGEPLFKYGHVFAEATTLIEPGMHVHVHNAAMPKALVSGDHTPRETLNLSGIKDLPTTFEGFLRANGKVGIRNYVLVVATVNCSSTVVKAICERFRSRAAFTFGHDGVIPIVHSQGCAQSSGGLGQEVLNRTLAGWMSHPNVVGALVVGLGCEETTWATIKEAKLKYGHMSSFDFEDTNRVQTLGIQDAGVTAKAIEAGVALVERILRQTNPAARQRLPLSKIMLALNCGGSDAFSGITANPILGRATDFLVALGGGAALAEIPECHGCESSLVQRCSSPEDKRKLQEIFAWWQDYSARHGVTLNDNLAKGNVAGGITTIIEKSLGAVIKCGRTPIEHVVDYAEPLPQAGVTVMNTPGYDPVSVTGLVAGGAQMVAFTTGRGSVFGCAIAPTLKIATTTGLYQRMNDDMDFDAGRLLGSGTLDQYAMELVQLMVEVASGRKTKSEAQGIGWEEFTPWAIAETL